jgi:zinc D-Ala-D-Ala carboxypeptidase
MLCPHCWGSKTEPNQPGTPCLPCGATGIQIDLQLSPHFSLGEMLFSDTAVRQHISNDPPPSVITNLHDVTNDLLEAIRLEFGPIHVNSGYRSPVLNAALSGHSKTSVHPLGLAADIKSVDPKVTRKMIVDFVIKARLPYDQVIFEGTWVHVGRRATDNKTVRKMALQMFPKPDGSPGYGPYDPNDPRCNQ